MLAPWTSRVVPCFSHAIRTSSLSYTFLGTFCRSPCDPERSSCTSALVVSAASPPAGLPCMLLRWWCMCLALAARLLVGLGLQRRKLPHKLHHPQLQLGKSIPDNARCLGCMCHRGCSRSTSRPTPLHYCLVLGHHMTLIILACHAPLQNHLYLLSCHCNHIVLLHSCPYPLLYATKPLEETWEETCVCTETVGITLALFTPARTLCESTMEEGFTGSLTRRPCATLLHTSGARFAPPAAPGAVTSAGESRCSRYSLSR